MEISNVCAKPDTMWAFDAVGGNHGPFNPHVWMDLIFSLYGRLITNSLVFGFTFFTVVPGRTKCSVDLGC